MRRVQIGTVLTAIAVLVIAEPAAAHTPVQPQVVASSARHFGAWAEPLNGVTKQQALTTLEDSKHLGATLPLVTDYLSWDDPFPTSFNAWVASHGQVLLLFVKLKLRNGARPKWADLANAKPGSTLYADMDRWAAGLRAYGKPVYFVFHKEPNEPANAVQGTSTTYRAAYRAFVTHLRAKGVTNVRYVWALPATIFAATATATSWYPGDDVVDVIGATGANHYGCLPGIAPHWRSFASIFAAMRSWAATYHPTRRTGVVEFETVEDPAHPGHKAQWISDAHAVTATSPWKQIEVLSYFSSTATDGGGFCDWQLTTSPSALAAAAAWARDPTFGG